MYLQFGINIYSFIIQSLSIVLYKFSICTFNLISPLVYFFSMSVTRRADMSGQLIQSPKVLITSDAGKHFDKFSCREL